MANPAPTQAAAPSGGGMRKWILLIVAVALMAAAGAATAVYLLTGHNETAKAPPPPPPPVFVGMDPFTVNLSGEDGERYLHIGLSLKVADAETQARITQHMPEVRSRVLLLLSSKQPQDLATIDGKRRLASEIRTLVAQPFAANMPQQAVGEVLFTAFVIQ
ncbi:MULTISPECIES: flagellar basal body-associated protein FliL [Pandoraea]|uniref:Flagellar protein FliL n=2 Tax=Pandoraea TaxID=93217 RepID=A0A5E4YZL1_9BURK|nr:MULTISPECIES: flagellar basal body-associated protein FliL [Pandoraea]ALS59619.1 flagellar basal body-associated protein FliL [Pandoraea norimbergensis]VVD62189.1 flagellar basal body protein FliL [Pandoraea iniqua]VVE53353.1 flagellar basal body protein FliL [Pandoraea iniqua]